VRQPDKWPRKEALGIKIEVRRRMTRGDIHVGILMVETSRKGLAR
jgi:hypothetical protein